MSNNNKVKDTINNLCAKYHKTSWKDILPEIFESDQFDLCINQLISDHIAGQPFTPTVKNMFKSFDLCPLDKVKVVFVANNPNPDKGVANGIPFSEYSNDFYLSLNNKTEGFENNYSLEYLPRAQGVMLLTAALTCPIGKPTDHVPMWSPITEKLIKAISYRTVKTIFVFVGKEVEHLASNVGKHHLKFFLPSVDEGWDPGDVFENINKALNKLEKTAIQW